MEVVVGKLSGFCFGVNNAVTKTSQLVKKQEQIYCLGELVHNKNVIANLEKQGLRTIKSVEESPKKSKLVLRAHGVSPEIYKLAEENENEIFDFTCPMVAKIHKQVEEKQKDNYMFILGEKNHPEVIGTKGFSGKDSFIIQTEEDIDNAITEFKKSNFEKLYIVAQTTFSVSKFDNIVTKILEKLKEYKIEVNKSICDSTKNRQAETEDLSKNVDYMIIIGGKNSANTIKLYEIAEKNCPSIHIENKEELDLEQIKKYKKIGITAGASTPKENIQEVVQILEEIE